MNTFTENRGIYGYQNSKRKKMKDLLGFDALNSSATDTGEGDQEYMAGLSREVEAASRQIDDSRRRWDNWIASDREKALLEGQKNHLVPKDSEERRRRLFVTSPNVVNDAIDEYYKETFRPNYSAKRSEAESKAFDSYREYASVPGANPFTALSAMNSEADPIDVIDKSLDMPDDGKLDRIAEKYARYAGLDPQSYRHSVLEPALRERVINELVDEDTPKSSIEYVGRSMWRNSLAGGLTDLAVQGYNGKKGRRFIEDAAMENYNPSRLERWSGVVGGLMLDTGVFAGLGALSSRVSGLATNAIKNRAVSGLMAKNASNGLTREAAEQIVKNKMVNSLSTQIVNSTTTQGLTLGAYDAAHSVVDDLLHGDEVDADRALKSFGKGAATGAALGVVGTPLRMASRGLTGGKRLAASAGVLSAESAVFTASTELEKVASGVEIEPIDLLYDFGESAATLLAMRMFHWRPSGGQEKLNSVGRIKKELRFSLPESREIARSGVDPDSFVANLERSLNVYQKNSEKAQERVREDYLKLMSDSELSASTRAKLLYIVENKLSSTPPVPFDYKIEEIGGDNYRFTTIDAEGRNIETIECNGREGLKSAMFTRTGDIRRNRIAQHEKMLMQKYDSQNFFRQAGRYAQETGTDVDVISDAMYRKANKEQLSETENAMLDDILRRSNYNDSEVGQMLYGMRRNLEQQYALNEGSLLEAVNKSSFHCSPNENAALNAYERMIESEVHKLYDGTSAQRAQELSLSGGQYSGMSNEELKRQENKDYTKRAIETGKGLNEGAIPTFTEEYGLFSKWMRKPDDWNPEYVWNVYRNKHSRKDIESMGNEAQELGRLLGCKVGVIRDESEISPNDAEYYDKIRSYGWFDELNDKIIINLPNNASIEDVKRTVVHEVVGHRGFAGLFGNYYYDFLEEVYNRGSSEVRAAIELQAKRKGGSFHAGTDEYLAILSERTTTTPEQRSIMRRLRDFITDMLRRFKIYREPISEKELVNLIQRHHSAMLSRTSPDTYRGSAFRPFETAHRRDGGYYNDRVAWERYNREMQRNPNLEGVAEGFHDFKRRIYGDTPMHHRYIGESGAKNLIKRGYDFYGTPHEAKELILKGFPPEMVKRMTGWEEDHSGLWRRSLYEEMPKVNIDNFLYNMIKKYIGPRGVTTYRRIMRKSPEEMTRDDRNFIKRNLRMATSNDKEVLLPDLVNDVMFFSAYPETRNVRVIFHPINGRSCFYDPGEQRLFVDKRRMNDPDFNKELDAAMHHILQDYENVVFTPMEVVKFTQKDNDDYKKAKYHAMGIRNLLKNDSDKETYSRILNSFKDVYGVSPIDFNKEYPTFSDFKKFIAKKKMSTNLPAYRKNVVETIDQLMFFIGGPIDVIREKNESNKMKSMYKRRWNPKKDSMWD